MKNYIDFHDFSGHLPGGYKENIKEHVHVGRRVRTPCSGDENDKNFGKFDFSIYPGGVGTRRQRWTK